MTREEAICKMLKYNSNVIHKTMTEETDPNEVEALDMAIKALEQEPKWIPVNERLPDAGENVLVTVNLGSVRVVGVDMYSLVEKDGFEGYGKDVIAWMPFPQPYSEVEDGND